MKGTVVRASEIKEVYEGVGVPVIILTAEDIEAEFGRVLKQFAPHELQHIASKVSDALMENYWYVLREVIHHLYPEEVNDDRHSCL